MKYEEIKYFLQRCEVHPDHQSGMITHQMLEDRLQEEIDELRAYIEAKQDQEVPEGWKLVPIEPTDVMCINGGEAVFDRLRPDFDDTEQDQEAAIYIYKQMLAAAPQGSDK